MKKEQASRERGVRDRTMSRRIVRVCGHESNAEEKRLVSRFLERQDKCGRGDRTKEEKQSTRESRGLFFMIIIRSKLSVLCSQCASGCGANVAKGWE